MKSLTACFLAAGLHCLPVIAAENPYPPGPDSKPQDGVPKGERIKGVFDQSKVFPGTTRDYTLYLPTQLDRSKSAPFMVLQDGGGYRADVVFDNLMAKKEIPALVGIFVNHGRVKALTTNALDRFNRSYEYDGLGDNYARFLIEELFPFIEQKHGSNSRRTRPMARLAARAAGPSQPGRRRGSGRTVSPACSAALAPMSGCAAGTLTRP